MPEREDFPDGSGGEEQWRAAMDEFVENNFTCKGIELRSADQHELKAGFFGEWHRRNGHGAIVEWVQFGQRLGAAAPVHWQGWNRAGRAVGRDGDVFRDAGMCNRPSFSALLLHCHA